MKHSSIPEILEDVLLGRPIVLVDDQDRENEGDIMVAAEKLSIDSMRFMLNEAKGLICLSLTEERLRALELGMQVTENSSSFGTNFAVSFDHRSVAEDAVSAAGRLKSILMAVNPNSLAEDFTQPGYVVPVVARPGGVLKRRGQTEGSVDLSALAGLQPAGVICEIMGSNGTMLRGAELDAFCEQHALKITSIDALVQYRLQHEVSIRRVADMKVCNALDLGRDENLKSLLANAAAESLRVVVYVDDVDDKEHFAIINGSPGENALVRIHSECLTGDVFGSSRCDCGGQLNMALAKILTEGEGIVIYLHQEGRGIGLGNKLKAYELQDQGLDTVDANLSLGFAADGRDYRVGAQILHDLGVQRIRLMTNNPAKVAALANFGITVTAREALAISPDQFNSSYLSAKRDRMGHLLPKE